MTYRWSFIALVACACSSKDPAPPPPRSPDPAPTTPPREQVMFGVQRLEEPPIELPKQTVFSVIEKGAEPRRPLRYELVAGESAYTSEVRMTSRQLVGGSWGPERKLPPIQNGIAISAGEAGGPLAARGLAGTVVGKTTPDVDRYLASWRAIENRRFTIGFDDRGRLGPITFADDPTSARSEAATDELAQRLLATHVPLPDEPVGPGAKWRVVTVLRQRPAVVKQTVTYTLVARTAKTWKIGVELLRVGEPQVLLDPDLPPETSIELVALVRRIEGTVELTPVAPLPRGTLEFTSTLHIRITQRTQGVSEQIFEDSGTIRLTTKR